MSLLLNTNVEKTCWSEFWSDLFLVERVVSWVGGKNGKVVSWEGGNVGKVEG